MSNSIKKEQHPSPWLIAGRVVFTLALIGCIAFIFSNSMKIASVSTVSSGDSMDVVTIISEITDAYDIEIPSEEMEPENFNSAKAIYEMIQRLEEE